MTSSQKILIIDDDVRLRDLYEKVLKDAGYSVTSAIDGQEGLVKAQEGGYDLILLDVIMPNVDGIKFLNLLKEKPPQTANGPIILLTNMAQDKIIEEGIKIGATSYIVKSDITPDQLIEHVKSFLKSPVPQASS